jgi:hypothetical protein
MNSTSTTLTIPTAKVFEPACMSGPAARELCLEEEAAEPNQPGRRRTASGWLHLRLIQCH